MARPNVLIFDDGGWIPRRARTQEERFGAFRDRHPAEATVVLELGAGTAIPTLRLLGEGLAQAGAALVRGSSQKTENKAR